MEKVTGQAPMACITLEKADKNVHCSLCGRTWKRESKDQRHSARQHMKQHTLPVIIAHSNPPSQLKVGYSQGTSNRWAIQQELATEVPGKIKTKFQPFETREIGDVTSTEKTTSNPNATSTSATTTETTEEMPDVSTHPNLTPDATTVQNQTSPTAPPDS
jgi:hypothetical protein